MRCECGEHMDKYVAKKPGNTKEIWFICRLCGTQKSLIPKKYQKNNRGRYNGYRKNING